MNRTRTTEAASPWLHMMVAALTLAFWVQALSPAVFASDSAELSLGDALNIICTPPGRVDSDHPGGAECRHDCCVAMIGVVLVLPAVAAPALLFAQRQSARHYLVNTPSTRPTLGARAPPFPC